MAGTLTLDTLKTSSGVFATQNGMTGISKCWVVFTGQGSATILNSYNVSSVTRTGTGAFTITFTTAMPSASYATNVTGGYNGSGNDWGQWYVGAMATTNIRCQFANIGVSAAQDPSYVTLSVFSS
jgi:hypothetical protein